ncbi:MAG: hypothetical protein IPK93_00755 [Solirubrobacterales bacterium]|nr:hypothetical protein [Solirubrobacterales bacterium]
MKSLRALNVGFGASRLAFGVFAGAFPEKIGRTWIGETAGTPQNQVILRALAGRDFAIGAGTIEAALRDDADTWLAVAALADLGDLASTLIARNDLPSKSVKITVALAGSAALSGIGLLVLNQLSD